MTSLFRRLRRDVGRLRADDTGSIPLALLITFIGVGLSTVLATVVMSELTTTRQSQERVQALSAAQAGIDVALGHLKAATSGVDAEGNPIGEVDLLPCGVITGRVGGPGSATYSVQIRYLRADPQGKQPGADQPWFDANQIPCVGGRPAEVPSHALVDAEGVELAGGTSRELTGTHVFKTTNANIAGGLVHIYQQPDKLDLCLDAGSADPAAGDPVRMQLCHRGKAAQTFAYTDELNLVLVSSRLSDPAGLGMCLDSGANNANGQVVRFQRCAADPVSPPQLWSLNDSANLQGTTNGTTLNGKCLNVDRPNEPGSMVVLGSCGGSYGNVRHWSLDAAVGAGMASGDTGRLVNFKQFARCIDQTKHDVNYPWIIVWPCKQTPNGDVSWNQKWTVRDLGGDRWSISTKPGATYCLRSPQAADGYVRVKQCDPTAPDAESTWKVSGDTGAYHTSYTIVDSAGYCLSPTDPAAENPDLHFEGDNVSKLIVARCDGSPLQKWNAPPDLGASTTLKDLAEK